jgi:hypothetical protein
MRAATMRRLLEGVLVVAGGASVASCCEVVSLGWSKSVGARWHEWVVPLDRPIATTDEPLDDALCTSICKREVSRCVVATLEFGPPEPQNVTCRYRLEGESEDHFKKVPLPMSGDQGSVSDPDSCRILCDEPNAVGRDCLLDDPPLSASMSGAQVVVCEEYEPAHCGGASLPAGRVPRGMVSPHTSSGHGGLLAAAAYLEAASVTAFERLAQALQVHGAPGSLARQARAAASDERRHAAQMARLAARFGARPAELHVEEVGEPSLFELAIDNARQGCVRESYGALLALHQARHAVDPELRATMAAIAADEAGHAALSWRVHRWARSGLDLPERAAVDAALVAASEELERQAPTGPSWLGLPSPRAARALARELVAALAAATAASAC